MTMNEGSKREEETIGEINGVKVCAKEMQSTGIQKEGALIRYQDRDQDLEQDMIGVKRM